MLIELNPRKWIRRPEPAPKPPTLSDYARSVLASRGELAGTVQIVPTRVEVSKLQITESKDVVQKQESNEVLESSKPAIAEENTMSVETALAAVGSDLKSFWTKLTTDVAKAKAIWAIISSPQTRSILLAVGQQAITTVKDATNAAESGGLNIALDSTVIADIKTLIADAQAGDGVIVSDLKAIGVVL